MKDFINKIKQFFKNIISRKKIKQLDKPKEIELIENQNNITQEQEEKKKFFELYNGIKKQTIDLNNIDREDLLKIRKLFIEEAKIQDKKLEEEINLLEMIKTIS